MNKAEPSKQRRILRAVFADIVTILMTTLITFFLGATTHPWKFAAIMAFGIGGSRLIGRLFQHRKDKV